MSPPCTCRSERQPSAAYGTKAPVDNTIRPLTSAQLSTSSTSLSSAPTTSPPNFTSLKKRRRTIKAVATAKKSDADIVGPPKSDAAVALPTAHPALPTPPSSSSPAITNIVDTPIKSDSIPPAKRAAPMSASPNKRPRLSGSFSPASPPYHTQAKRNEQSIQSIQPKTPTSPYMSSESQDHGQSKGKEIAQAPIDVEMADAGDNTHKRTDHDRHGDASNEVMDFPRLSLDPIKRSRPHVSDDLTSLYSLQSLVSPVIRKDLKTGEKINKLRKSYETHIKQLNLAGKNKPVSKPGHFLNMMAIPELNWKQELPYFDMDAELDEALLDEALDMRNVTISPADERKWRNVVDADISNKPKPFAAAQKKPIPGAATASTLPAKPSTPLPAADRPSRVGKKRHYNDSSFVGYGEGYEDDMAESTGGEEDRLKKKRRKDFSAPSMSDRPGSFSSQSAVRVQQR